ncbi:hypothetical protein N7481_008562 [Penicillium waksmanii]|uniref:uncharacterized protein n=1 Tax=Penicillium waksmanii TaxID=69791 RepID=UPI002548A55E|nr:uncharacterized protein N7481_008562 [Penicillium waksmanii]KAJ5974855.1 hypothetical protein N7481_008562 [Penicillium waksmanii]
MKITGPTMEAPNPTYLYQTGKKAYTRADWTNIGDEEHCATLGKDEPGLGPLKRLKHHTGGRSWTKPGKKSLGGYYLHEIPRQLGVLKVGSHGIIESEDKAQAFLRFFFPKMDTPVTNASMAAPLELPWQLITELEIQRSLKAA